MYFIVYKMNPRGTIFVHTQVFVTREQAERRKEHLKTNGKYAKIAVVYVENPFKD